jgi:hypothetical protein
VDLHSNAEVVRGAAVGRQVGGFPLSMSRDQAIRARASVPRPDSSMVKKALSWTLLGSGRVAAITPARIANGLPTEGPSGW